MNIPSIPPDKAQHFFWGSIAGFFGACLGLAIYLRFFGVTVWLMPLLALVAAGAAGAWKEWQDDLAGKEWDPDDLRWTLAGATPQALFLALTIMAAWTVKRS